ncbi:ATP-dependent endonuclease [Dactylosporangium sucinum]|uniref:ATP-dependent nuclease n=1 Tax=Dactylosporangium sucinum TaxID=1424081 RepID=UPI001E419EAE|nr:ATP-dependent endonuclease [Dactylosporangium sucinum]
MGVRVKTFRVRNFRRLRNVGIDLDADTTVFVGANNSGKTSAAQVFRLFLGSEKGRFQLYDFTADCWAEFDAFDPSVDDPDVRLPRIELDIWLDLTGDEVNLHRVVDFLPDLGWESGLVGVRLSYRPKNAKSLIENFVECHDRALATDSPEGSAYAPWPQTLTEYLTRELQREYQITYAVLDTSRCDEHGEPVGGYVPDVFGGNESGLGAKLDALICVDFLDAQRHLVDGESRGRSENLSRKLSGFYARHLEQHEHDLKAAAAIADSESRLNTHYEKAFEPTLDKLANLGYPGFVHPRLMVKAALNPHTILSSGARVHYALPAAGDGLAGTPERTLPDQYNGLGFKNLIFMVVEVLDFHHRWIDAEGERPPIHLVFIEEPEAHLHAQLQQVFIRKIREILPPVDPAFTTQMVVTTHSAHIIYEKSFEPIRYFKRAGADGNLHHTDVKDLMTFQGTTSDATRHFLRQYLRLTHCDLFFADAAILVEGNVERLVLPLIIQQSAPELQSSHLTILEVGGAFTHKFRKLLDFLGLPALVVTDIDSVHGATSVASEQDPDEEADGRKACMTTVAGAVTSNETLATWIPGIRSIDDLLDLDEDKKCPPTTNGGRGHIRIAYETRQTVTWGADTEDRAGRTFEEAFALQNLAWCQEPAQADLRLRVAKAASMTLDELHQKIHNRVRGFDKTDFALALITKNLDEWLGPQYIVEGLLWLRDRVVVDASDVVALPMLDQEVGE